MLQQHGGLLQASHDLPKQFAGGFHHTFQKRAVAVAVARVTAVAGNVPVLEFYDDAVTFGTGEGRKLADIHDAFLKSSSFRGNLHLHVQPVPQRLILEGMPDMTGRGDLAE